MSAPVREADSNELPLRSLNPDVQTYVTFVNKTKRVVNLFWLDYKGERVNYGKIRPGRVSRMDTYVTHPWTTKDSVTSFTLLMNGQRFFHPRKHLNGVYFQERHRDIVTIGIPVFTLLQRCVEVAYYHYGKEKLQTMDLPQELRQTLINVAGPSFDKNYEELCDSDSYFDEGEEEEEEEEEEFEEQGD